MTFHDARGVDSHFAFTTSPSHPQSKAEILKRELSRENETDRYPSNWKSVRQRILQRDEYQCQNQGCDTQGGPHSTAKLQVHHKTPLSEGGSHRTSNLITLCQTCHSDHHGWPIGRNDEGQLWLHGSGDDLLVRCGRCNQVAILRRNPDDNRIICSECGNYEIVEDQPKVSLSK
ncbi:HNH endonuclease (plasmid) [Halobaculum rubrum]|nr:HNH endonuclease [Halobaculum rubrum]